YLRFMGAPLESSRGCLRNCRFCLAPVMQKTVAYRSAEDIARVLAANPREFVNVVDYNLGNDRSHLLSLAGLLGRSPAAGWMGEFCVEALDDEEVLEALARSRCRAAYCGLESLLDSALAAVRKGHNLVADYRRIIRKAQSRGVEVAAGFVIGMEGTTRETFPAIREFCAEAGILYLKLTTLTFNPGTEGHAAMAPLGRYLSEDPSRFDGVRLTYLPRGVSEEVLREGTRDLIESFYSLSSAWRRSRHLAARPARRAEFMLFSRCFGQAYRDWLEAGALDRADGGMDRLLGRPLRQGLAQRVCEEALVRLRRRAARA
ncbi:MAG: radical SAM protein, partial [Elusimicrobia bacterium]|nr:radical SAM protein [Elusimicrobiota bacterium]